MRNLHGCICRLRIELDVCWHGRNNAVASLPKSFGGTRCMRSVLAALRLCSIDCRECDFFNCKNGGCVPSSKEVSHDCKQQPRRMPSLLSLLCAYPVIFRDNGTPHSRGHSNLPARILWQANRIQPPEGTAVWSEPHSTCTISPYWTKGQWTCYDLDGLKRGPACA